MFNKFLNRLNLGLVGVGLALANTVPVIASAPEASAVQEQEIATGMIKNQRVKSNFIADGVYLYGQSSQRDQIGKEYLVFQVDEGNIVGAIYYPQSEFNCFTGNIEAQELNLSIIDPYNGETYPYSIAQQNQALFASSSAPSSRDSNALVGYEKFDHLSENDQQMLNECQNNLL